MTLEKKLFLSILMLLTLVCFVAVFVFIPRVPQANSYHQFSDVRKIAGIPNFINVISNIPFILVSLLGFLSLRRQWVSNNLTAKEAIVFFIIFFAIFLSGIGSAYYHWRPDNARLVWDRAPMSIVFMSLLAFTIMERVNLKLGFWLLIPLNAFGIFSVLYWHWTELIGEGDLRLYGITQYYTIILLMIIVGFFPKSYPPLKIYVGMIFFYGLAKLFEHFDLKIYQFTGIISGHSLKHIFAALSTYGIVMMLNRITSSDF
jgi:hypothetical protein